MQKRTNGGATTSHATRRPARRPALARAAERSSATRQASIRARAGLGQRWSSAALLLALAAACQPETLGEDALPDAGANGGADTAADVAQTDSQGVDTAAAGDAAATDSGVEDGGGDAKDGACTVAAECGAATVSCRRFDCVKGACQLVASEDGVACTSDDNCVENGACKVGECVGTAKDCEDGNDCTKNSCDAATGDCKAKALADGGACDDGDACTKGDVCAAGKCAPGTSLCECKTDKFCQDAHGSSTDLCVAQYYCDKSIAGKFKCEKKPNTEVTCKDDGNSCTKVVCEPKSGTCKPTPANDNSPCDNGDLCNQAECQKGACTATTQLCECTNNDFCVKKNSAYDPCKGKPYCDKSKPGDWKCAMNPAAAPTCGAGADSVCAKNVCLSVVDGKSGVTIGAKCQLSDTNKLRPICKAKAGSAQKCTAANASAWCKDHPDDCTYKYDPKYTATISCDDGNSCTINDLCQGGSCASGDVNLCKCQQHEDCQQFDDDNLCNGVQYCDVATGECKINPASVKSCTASGDTACIRNYCLEATGKCQMTPTEFLTTTCKVGSTCNCDTHPELCVTTYDPKKKTPKACNDGNDCTQNDTCGDGKCLAGAPNVCTCKTDNDCAKKDDGDLCNGTLYCDLKSGSCKTNPATVVSCPSVDDGFCRYNICEPKTGQCVPTPREKLHSLCNPKTKICKYIPATDVNPANLSVICDDGNSCTPGDICKEGVCTTGATNTCVCKIDSDCVAKDDGDLCNGTMYCDKTGATAVCKVNPATKVTCPSVDDTECSANRCDKKTGKCAKTPVNDNQPCDADSNPCTVGDTCAKGVCEAGTNTCQCENDADCSKFEDGDGCNGTLFCNKSGTINSCDVNPATFVVCNVASDTSCMKNLCQKKTGKCAMTPVSDGKDCDDGETCTVGDTCEKGVCASGLDICKCKKTSDCYDSDGDACNAPPKCNVATGKCESKGAGVTCQSGGGEGSCVTTACNKFTGKCVPVGDDAKCADQSPCTLDSCGADGACANKPVVDGAACVVGKEAGACLSGVCLAAPANTRLVPAMKFWMGCNPAIDQSCGATSDQNPQHEVTLTKAFFVHRSEVTAGAYDACVKAGACTARATTAGCHPATSGAAKLPANCVSHGQAIAYCSSLKMRLPTEAEWEGAARGDCDKNAKAGAACKTMMRTYPWGDSKPSCDLTVWMEGKTAGCGTSAAWAVGSKSKDRSPYGVLDMGGNVAEWVADWYDKSSYSKNTGGVSDPTGPTTGTSRVIRGGSYGDSLPALIGSANRKSSPPISQQTAVGFRCVQTVK